MREILYKGFCIVQLQNGSYQIAGYTNIFYALDAAKSLIDVIEQSATKANTNCRPFKSQKN